jgi:GTP-binding protein
MTDMVSPFLALGSRCQFVTSAPCISALPEVLTPEVVFWGRSNVGKSSLLNALLGRRQLARTSKTPGRTQAIQFYSVPPHMMLVDMPGYGYSKVPDSLRKKWEVLVNYYFSQRSPPWKIFLLMDSRYPLQPKDWAAMDLLDSLHRPYSCILTKTDLIPPKVLAQNLEELKPKFQEIWPVSCKTKKGIQELGVFLYNLLGTHRPEAK